MRYVNAALSITAAGIALGVAPVRAQNQSAASDAPTSSALVVGALQIASDADLVVAGFDLRVATDTVVYSYVFKNAGGNELALTASIVLPQLRDGAGDEDTFALASNDPNNPIGLSVTSGGAPTPTKPEVHAYALGLDRLAEIKAEHLPLMPLGPDAQKAIAALTPAAADRLAALGVLSPRDPAQPSAPRTADWSLETVHSWRQTLPPGKTTPVVVKFTPIKAEYRLVEEDAQEIDDMTDEVCLTPAVMAALKGRLKGANAWKVSDLALSIEPPAQWVDNPGLTVSVQKPRPNAIVAFCGMDEKTGASSPVLGAPLSDNDSGEIRVLIFEPAVR